MTDTRLETYFLDGPSGRLFTVLHRARNSNSCVVFVPPFAEEMNKCRRQVTETALRFVANGYSAVIVDLFGTGDSDGDFEDASWRGWTRDIAFAVRWAGSKGLRVAALVGTRLGGPLAVESLARDRLMVPKIILWQPVDSGEYHINQFLRYGVAASIMKNNSSVTVDVLKKRLGDGETVEIAGYPLSAALWSELRQIQMAELIREFSGDVHIFDVKRRLASGGSLSRSKINVTSHDPGHQFKPIHMHGEPFWSSAEIVVNRELGMATVSIAIGSSSNG